jgi:hypothetical protein
MTELRPHGRELIAAAQRERSLGAAERERILNGLLAAAERSKTGIGKEPVERSLQGTAKLLVLLAVVLLIVLGLYVARHAGERRL